MVHYKRIRLILVPSGSMKMGATGFDGDTEMCSVRAVDVM